MNSVTLILFLKATLGYVEFSFIQKMIKYKYDTVFGMIWRYLMNSNSHLTLDERNFIEQELAKNSNFREIAKFLF